MSRFDIIWCIWGMYCTIQLIYCVIKRKYTGVCDYMARCMICILIDVVSRQTAHYILLALFVCCILLGTVMLVLKAFPISYKIIGVDDVDTKSTMYNKDIVFAYLRALVYFSLWRL